ncbi:UNVERIFIED_CONTAM: hypothetical protein HDU68_005979, partial [Siphonaria sp. JEL0065]
MSGMCVSLSGSTACPDFAGLSALAPAQAVQSGSITDVASLDRYIKDTSSPDGSFGAAMRDPTIFNCPNWDGTGFRYYTSVLCATLVAQ